MQWCMDGGVMPGAHFISPRTVVVTELVTLMTWLCTTLYASATQQPSPMRPGGEAGGHARAHEAGRQAGHDTELSA